MFSGSKIRVGERKVKQSYPGGLILATSGKTTMNKNVLKIHKPKLMYILATKNSSGKLK